jgi:hypothetical protein
MYPLCGHRVRHAFRAMIVSRRPSSVAVAGASAAYEGKGRGAMCRAADHVSVTGKEAVRPRIRPCVSASVFHRCAHALASAISATTPNAQDLGEERRQNDLTRSEPSDEAHGRTTARTRPRPRDRNQRGGRWRRRDPEDRSTGREIVSARPGCEEPEVADADEAFR